MKVLVVAASKHGSTTGIAETIAAELSARGHEALFADAGDYGKRERPDLSGFDAFVIGSAVYLGRWMKPARRFVDANAEALAAKPVWMFSSGPTGDEPPADEEAVHVDELVERIGAREHRVFGGSLDEDDLGPIERTMIRAAHAPYGDFRDWDEVRAWAAHIAGELAPGA